jgi:5'-phosphate synthase pdxT subunit
MTIGVLALQGAFAEHIAMLQRLGVDARPVRLPEELNGLDGIVLPGGESTAIGKLMETYGLTTPLRQRMAAGLPVYGTCAGLILLADTVEDGIAEQPTLGGMDIVARRNAFGRQLDSFEQDIAIPAIGEEPFHAVFIRAPAVAQIGAGVHALAQLADGTIVAAQEGARLVTAFHPELSGDTRLHAYFATLCAGTAVPTERTEGRSDTTAAAGTGPWDG